MRYERRKTLHYVAPKTGEKITLEVGEFGKVWHDKILLKQHVIDQVQGYSYAIPPTSLKFNGLLPVHRLVALAWVEGRSKDRNFVKHVDGNRLNNKMSNLEWTTRTACNSTPRSRKLRSDNASHVKHATECIKATRRGEVKYFKNGKVAAKAIGCSSPLIYMVLNPNHFAKTAKGWTLEWVDIGEIQSWNA